jgi:hypothetical protein
VWQAARRAKKSLRLVRRLAISRISSGGKHWDGEESTERSVEEEEDEDTRRCFPGDAIPRRFWQPRAALRSTGGGRS